MLQLQQGGEIISMSSDDLVEEEPSTGGDFLHPDSVAAETSISTSSNPHQIIAGGESTPQIIKNSMGQYIIVQQNPVSINTFVFHQNII